MCCETGPDTSTGRAGNGTGNGAVDGTKAPDFDSRHSSKFKRGKTELLHDTRGLLSSSFCFVNKKKEKKISMDGTRKLVLE